MKRRVVLFVMFLYLPLALAAQQNIEDMRSRNAALKKEIATLEQRIKTTSNNLSGQLQKLELSRQLVRSRQEVVRSLTNEITLLEGQIKEKQREVQRLTQVHREMLSAYEALLQNAYTHRNGKSKIMYLLSSNSFAQAVRRWRYFRSYSEYMSSQVVRIKAAQAAQTAALQELEALRGERQKTLAQKEQEVSQLQKEEKAVSQDVTQLKKNDKALRALLQKRKDEQAKLDQQIAKAVEEARRKNAASKGGQEANKALSAQFSKNKGKLPPPVRNAVIKQYFGKTKNWLYGFDEQNNGITFLAPQGAPIMSVFDGQVSVVFFDPFYLNCILVSHGGEYYTLYSHIATLEVKEGQQVATGQVLGYLDANGSGEFQFQLLQESKNVNKKGDSKGGTPLNPLPWLSL